MLSAAHPILQTISSDIMVQMTVGAGTRRGTHPDLPQQLKVAAAVNSAVAHPLKGFPTHPSTKPIWSTGSALSIPSDQCGGNSAFLERPAGNSIHKF